jgi:hypothetical protein
MTRLALAAGFILGFIAALALIGPAARAEFACDIRYELRSLRQIRTEHPRDLTRFGRWLQRMAGGYKPHG